MREVLLCGAAEESEIIFQKGCISINTHLSTIPAVISFNVRRSRAMRKAKMGVAAAKLLFV
jgi:hypothetical protein